VSGDKGGELYGHGHHPGVVFNHARRSVADSAAYLRPHLREGMSVLDLGCGPGSITVDIARLVAPGLVTGVDNAESVIVAAKEAASGRGIDNLRFEVADAYRLPFSDDSFDAAHAHQVLQHLTDPVAALAELRRVVRPGGIIAARDADYETMVHSPGFAGIDQWRSLYCRVADEIGAEPRAGRMLVQWFHQAGLEEIQASSSTWSFSTPSERRFWADAWIGRLLHARLNELAKRFGLASQEELQRMADDWEAWARHESGFFTFLHGEALARAPG
jgi:ubiquinone/menaquinone biosynthesis C-methylase UbiE